MYFKIIWQKVTFFIKINKGNAHIYLRDYIFRGIRSVSCEGTAKSPFPFTNN